MIYNNGIPVNGNYQEFNVDWLIDEIKKALAQWKETKTDFNNLENDFDDLKKYIENYFENLNIQNEVNEKLNSMVQDGTLKNLLTQRYCLYFGNSYSLGVGSETGQGIYARTKDFFADAWLKYAGSGTGFLQYDLDHATDTFGHQLDNYINDGSIDKTLITDIMVVGAWGDSRAVNVFGYSDAVNRFYAAMSNFVQKAKSNYPNLKNIYYTWAESRSIMIQSLANGVKSTPYDYYLVNRIMSYVCNRTGFTYLGASGFNILWRSGFFSNDKYHPNNFGYEYISNFILNSLKGIVEYSPVTFNNNTILRNFIPGGILSYGFVLLPDKCVLELKYINVENATSNIADNEQNENCFNSSGNNMLPILNTDNGDILIETNFNGRGYIEIKLYEEEEGSKCGLTFKYFGDKPGAITEIKRIPLNSTIITTLLNAYIY